jgi:cytochrome b
MTAVRVWPPVVRILHWSLVAGFAAAWFTRHSPGAWHEWLGYGVWAVVLVRVILGFTGSRRVRFSGFVRRWSELKTYFVALLGWRQPRYVGHNPLGGLMVLALLGMVFLTCASGWLYTTDRYWGVEWVETLHDALSWATIGLIALHISGVLMTSAHDRENLVAAMINGRKRPPDPGDID